MPTDTTVLDQLRELDTRSLLNVGYATVRNGRLAAEKGNLPLAGVHGCLSVIVDRALMERAAKTNPELVSSYFAETEPV